MSQDPEQEVRIMSEHAKRDGLSHPEVEAAYCYVDKVLNHAEKIGGSHLWYGWSMREAFLAGCSYVHAQKPEPEPAQEQRFVEFTRAFPPAQLTIKADGKTLDALIEKEGISLFDVDRILREEERVEEAARGDTDFQVQWKEDPDTDPVYHWEVRDMEDQFQAGGQASTLPVAMSSARGYAYQYAPCKVRVWTERTIYEETFDD